MVTGEYVRGADLDQVAMEAHNSRNKDCLGKQPLLCGD
jgi:hypothetical protein